MKMHFGHISNSSSSSFIVVLKKPKEGEPDYLEAINFFMKRYACVDSMDKVDATISEHIKSLKKEVKELLKDKEILKKDKAFFEGLLKDENLQEPLGKLLGYLYNRRNGTGYPLSQVRFNRKQAFSEEPKEVLKRHLSYISQNLINLNKLLEKVHTRLVDITPYNDDSWKIIGFEEDAYGSVLSQALLELEKKGFAKILKKERS